MNLEEKINQDLKEAMKAKDQIGLRGIRAIKQAILLHKTSGAAEALDSDGEVKMLQKLVKQRRDSLAIFEQQNREALAQVEREEIEVIEKYLPKQLNADELEAFIKNLVAETGASGMKDMGKIMGAANKQLAGKAEGSAISAIVKKILA
ncbi:MAG: hypothetical protein RL757_1612 [Bacteroidota bacterium]|jgi:uncharacterized protein YqeY